MIYYVKTTYFDIDKDPEDVWLGSDYKWARERFQQIIQSSKKEDERIEQYSQNLAKIYDKDFLVMQLNFIMKLTDLEQSMYSNGICPNCGDNDVNSVNSIFFDDAIEYYMFCEKCEFEFKENYSVKFEGIEA